MAQNDPAAILASIAELSWRLAIVLCFPVTLVMVFDTLGWRFAFLRDGVAFRTLVTARLAGEAFNATTPTAALGGEAVKA
ncbi:MAG: flippase-like domain-containing protein, partial [Candidatus Rokubacteria bacterium]|nr:flippase-like domain-containing protein [Candidatus Rokubacteria bacterium]